MMGKRDPIQAEGANTVRKPSWRMREKSVMGVRGVWKF